MYRDSKFVNSIKEQLNKRKKAMGDMDKDELTTMHQPIIIDEPPFPKAENPDTPGMIRQPIKETAEDDKIEVGKHNDVADSEFDKEQLEVGILVEMEHTSDREIAKSIAKDHLIEDKDYYTKLKKMEASKKADSKEDLEKEIEMEFTTKPNQESFKYDIPIGSKVKDRQENIIGKLLEIDDSGEYRKGLIEIISSDTAFYTIGKNIWVRLTNWEKVEDKKEEASSEIEKTPSDNGSPLNIGDETITGNKKASYDDTCESPMGYDKITPETKFIQDGLIPVSRTYGGLLTPIAQYILKKCFDADIPTMITGNNYSRKFDYADVPFDVDKTTLGVMNGNAFYSDKIITTSYSDYNGLDVTCYSKDRDVSKQWIEDFEAKMIAENQYRGKCLFAINGLLDFQDVPKVDWDDVILDEKVKKDIRLNTVSFLGDEKLAKAGVFRRGLIMYGPPGTGKTSIVKAIFSELQDKHVSRIYVTAESFGRMSARTLFDILQYLGPTVLAFEDIDMVGISRDIMAGGSLLGDLLTNLDGMRNMRNPLVVMASTNKMSMLDEALANRPCRFDRKIEVGLPTAENLQKIYTKLLGNGVEESVIKLSKDFTGSHVVETVNTAKILSASEEKEIIECLLEACGIIRSNFFPGQTLDEIKAAKRIALIKLGAVSKDKFVIVDDVENKGRKAIYDNELEQIIESNLNKYLVKAIHSKYMGSDCLKMSLKEFNQLKADGHMDTQDYSTSYFGDIEPTKFKMDFAIGDKVLSTDNIKEQSGEVEDAGVGIPYAIIKWDSGVYSLTNKKYIKKASKKTSLDTQLKEGDRVFFHPTPGFDAGDWGVKDVKKVYEREGEIAKVVSIEVPNKNPELAYVDINFEDGYILHAVQANQLELVDKEASKKAAEEEIKEGDKVAVRGGKDLGEGVVREIDESGNIASIDWYDGTSTEEAIKDLVKLSLRKSNKKASLPKIAISVQKGEAYVKRYLEPEDYEYDGKIEAIIESDKSDDDKFDAIKERVIELFNEIDDDDIEVKQADWDEAEIDDQDIMKLIEYWNADADDRAEQARLKQEEK